MGSYQPATKTSGGGLPVCLSGIGLHPRAQSSSRRHYLHHQHNEVIRPMYSCRQKSIREQDVSSTEEAILDESDRLNQTTLNEVRLRHNILQERPRHSLALQMAELDHRRETIRKHRSNRGLVNSVDEQRAFLELHSNRKHGVVRAMLQNPSFQNEFVRVLQHHNCAKAA